MKTAYDKLVQKNIESLTNDELLDKCKNLEEIFTDILIGKEFIIKIGIVKLIQMFGDEAKRRMKK